MAVLVWSSLQQLLLAAAVSGQAHQWPLPPHCKQAQGVKDSEQVSSWISTGQVGLRMS
jgi:hypothetical protein